MFGGSGADPGFLLGGGASPRNDVTDGEVKKFEKRVRIYEDESFIWGGGGGGAHPLHRPPRSAPAAERKTKDCAWS